MGRIAAASQDVMRLTSNAVMAVLLIASTGAIAQGRIYTRTFTCSDLKAFVDRSGNAVLASSELAYEAVHRDGGVCEQDETSAPAYEPTADVPACFVGWRCKQRNSDSNQK